jgi:hypothetical protein
MTNPGAAIKMLITYAICIPLALFVGYILTDPLNYGTLGFLGLVIALILSPLFIKWHYPIMVFSLAFPAYLFFLVGDPPAWEVGVLMCLGIAIVERTMNPEKRFLSVPSMTWPLLVTMGVIFLTAWLTGGFGLHQLGGTTGGGKKYIVLLSGILGYFALSSRRIPREHWKLYVGLYFLAALPSFISDMFPFLPAPLNYINLLFPPTQMGNHGDVTFGLTRLGALGTTANAVFFFMLARYGLRGILFSANVFRAPLLILMLGLSMLGGFRGILITNLLILVLLFFYEGLHRTRFLLVAIMGLTLLTALLVPFSKHLPYTFQRSLTFLPLDLDPQARLDAEGSTEWRLEMWHDLWPKVPEYLMLGKGYLLTAADFEMMGDSVLGQGYAAKMDSGSVGLAASGDYHSGPLSTLIPFGVWGAVAFLWATLAGLRVLYRNLRYGDPELRSINAFLLAWYLQRYLTFFFIFGGFEVDLGLFVRTVGFSVALNGGVRGPLREPAKAMRFKPLAPRQPQPA